MADDVTEASLELTFLSVEGLKDSIFLGNARTFVVAWIDPSLKRSTKKLSPSRSRNPTSTSQKLHFPLFPRTLQNPCSSLTIQVLTSRLPFRGPKIIGTAILPFSSLQLSGENLTVQLRKPSGRLHGVLRFSARILWCLGAAVLNMDCVTGVPAEVEVSDFPYVDPTAPPMPDDLAGPPLANVHPVAVPMLVGSDGTPKPVQDGTNAWRSFLIGLASGAVAAVLVGAAGLAEG